MVDLKATAANIIAPGSGFFVKAFDKAKEWKDKAADAARTAKERVSEKLSAAKTRVVGAASTTVVQSGYEAPKGKIWAQPGVVFIVAFFLFLYLRFIGVRTLANWILISASASLIVGVIFKEPKKGFIILLLPAIIYFLDLMKMLTSANTIFAVGFVLTIVLMTFEKTREFSNKLLTVLVFLLGGIFIFWLSAWAQIQMNVPYPFIITFVLLLGYFFYVISRPGKLKWAALFVNLIFFLVIFATPTLIAYPGSSLYAAVDSQRQGMIGVYSSIVGAGKGIAKGVQSQIYIATGDYEMGVEAQSKKPLGVFMDNVGVTAPIVKENDKIDVFARLRVESFKTGENLTVNVKCYVDGMKDKTGEIRPRNNFSVEEFEMQELDCIMPAAEPGIGSPSIVLETVFDFTTSAFLKSYFMDQETIRSMRRNQIDPLDSFKIADKNPIAKFTGGPLMIGMGAGQQPVALVAGEQFGPTLSITFDRNWLEGELWNMTNLSITVPPGLDIEDIDGNSVLGCKGEGNKEQTCILGSEILNVLFASPVTTPKTVRVHTKLKDSTVLLANAPLAIRSFKITATYNYVIKKKVGVTVRALEIRKTSETKVPSP